MFGVAPFDHQLSRFQGTRRHGGLAHSRKLLYMAATSAPSCHHGFQASCRRLRDDTKEQIPLVALMRKLLTLIHALLRGNRLFQPEAPSIAVPA